MESLFNLLFVVTPLFLLYLLPALIANWRKHPNRNSVFLVNLFFGWTFIGWVMALIWACSSISPQVVYLQQPPATN